MWLWGVAALLCDGDDCVATCRNVLLTAPSSVRLPQSPSEGAFSPIYCAVAEEMEGITGKYIDSDCAMSLPAPLARDPTLGVKGFEISQRLTSKL